MGRLSALTALLLQNGFNSLSELGYHRYSSYLLASTGSVQPLRQQIAKASCVWGNLLKCNLEAYEEKKILKIKI